jgi:hypothetical protein
LKTCYDKKKIKKKKQRKFLWGLGP